jgi:hypothetical protein
VRRLLPVEVLMSATNRGSWSVPRRARLLVRRLRSLVLLGVLSLALMIVELVTGCDTPAEEEQPPVYYGPPPADVVGDADAADVGEPDATSVDALVDVPNGDDSGPVVYYGPQPVDVLEDVPNVDDAGPVVYYGPQPVDVLEDVPNVDDAGPVVYYGPQPVDVVADSGPADVVDHDCPPMAFYGPPPCTSDDDCVSWYGAGWYCDSENTYPDGCGGTIAWAACKEKP